MLYVDVRDKIKSMDLIATSAETLVSRMIRMYTMSTYGHVGTAYIVERPHIEKRVLLFESKLVRGVHFTALSSLPKFYWMPVYPSIEFTDAAENFIWQIICTGADYDISGVVRRAFGLNPINDTRYYCSELVTRLFGLCNVELPERANRDPATLIDILLEQGVVGSPHLVVNPEAD